MATTTERLTDMSLWERTCQDDCVAFEELVRRHQSVVSAVAYNGCGDLSLSEDIAQETFWVAWRERAALLDPSRLRAWLCGIARNMARNSNRRPERAAAQLDEHVEPIANIPQPHEEAVSREEESLVWEALEAIPENYREPLILFYREHQSVAEVADALDLSADAVKQRLSRGREMLREQVASVVEGALRRSRPRAGFTLGVMAGLSAMTTGTKAAMAGTGAMTGSALALKGVPAAMLPAGPVLATSSGILGGLAGTLLGLAGGWFGSWLPAQFAPTNRERLHQLKVGKRMLCVSAVLAVLLFVLVITQATTLSKAWLAGITFGWVMLLNLYIMGEIVLLVRAIKKIRAETPAESDPNDSPVKAYFQQKLVQPNGVSRWEGRVYRSRWSLLGVPLIDINVSDPIPSQGSSPMERPEPKKACGWIAIGDKADGILLALGGIARGGVAIGGFAMGIIGIGGISIGLLTLGGLSIGAIALGGAAFGGIALGGSAIGWQAGGGLAIAWDVASGGGAIAYHAAFGGGALAHDYAVGGGASAIHANDAAAHAILDTHWLVTGMKWLNANNTTFTTVVVIVSLLPTCLLVPLMYRRRREDHTF